MPTKQIFHTYLSVIFSPLGPGHPLYVSIKLLNKFKISYAKIYFSNFFFPKNQDCCQNVSASVLCSLWHPSSSFLSNENKQVWTILVPMPSYTMTTMGCYAIKSVVRIRHFFHRIRLKQKTGSDLNSAFF